jgi:hypothetical protein
MAKGQMRPPKEKKKKKPKQVKAKPPAAAGLGARPVGGQETTKGRKT